MDERRSQQIDNEMPIMSTTELIPELKGGLPETVSDVPSDQVRRVLWRRRLTYLVFGLCVSLYLFPFMRMVLRGTDEGILVTGAVRTVHGQLLGRDFVEVVGPGTFYWLALFFKLFGVTFFASRVCLFVSTLGTALSFYFLSRRVCAKHQLLPFVLLIGMYFGTFWPGISHHVDGNFFALLAVVCMVLWQESKRTWPLIASGVLVGLTTLTLQTKGLLLLPALLLWLWMQRRKGPVSVWAPVWVMGGFLGPICSVLGYFWSRGALRDLIYANVVWPAHSYGPTFSVPYAFLTPEYFKRWILPIHGINWTYGMATVLIIPFLFVAAVPFLTLLLSVRHGIRDIRPQISLYWFAGAALWLSELHRKDIAHLVFGCPLLILLCVFYLQELKSKTCGVALSILSITSYSLCVVTLFVALAARPMSTRAGRIYGAGYDPVLSVIEEHVPPGKEIFIYPYAPMDYFLTGTSNPTRFSTFCFNFNFGSGTQLEEVTRALEQHKVKYVVWD
jgi:Dolichyl-phosphate-mannose-protein mannosyltransferase